MQSLNWYLNRLGRMSTAEVMWRASRALRAAGSPLDAVRVPPPDPSARAGVTFVHVPEGIDPLPYTQAAATILRGEHDIFDLKGFALGRDPRWNQDPLTGRSAPLIAASLLDYRDEQRVGNIKYLWEPNRHLHLVTLAQAYALTRDPVYAREVGRHVDSWIAQCPPGKGPNWASSLELGIRLINWSLAWQLLGGGDSELFAQAEGLAFRERWLESIYLHTRTVVRNLSRFSSANNHLIGEASGVWIAAATWPLWPEMRQWGDECREILLEEALRQNAPDGGNREQAISYQQFVFDFLLLAGLAARATRRDFPEPYWERLEHMVEFVASLLDAGGNMPMIGDADDGYAVRLAPQGECSYAAMLAAGGLLFGRTDFASPVVADSKALWLFGKKAGVAEACGVTRAYPQSGYYVLGKDFGAADEIKLIADAGPLGYLSLAAHGHADALAIVLSVGGQPVLVDPGTYCYHTEPGWRRYFRSTSAHNTVSVDGKDQSVQDGTFMWSRHAEARCLEFDVAADRQVFAGEHAGYGRLADPVLHRRRIEFIPGSGMFLLDDQLDAAGPHRYRRHWHFHPEFRPTVHEGRVEICTQHHRIVLSAAEPVVSRVHRGGTVHEGGWYSPAFGIKVPTTTVVWETQASGSVVLRTTLAIESL